jgi:putative transposase
MNMKRVIALKLEPSQQQYLTLLMTMRAFNLAAQSVADTAFQIKKASQVALHRLLYRKIRAEFQLSSQMAVRAISKAVEAYKRDKNKRCKFDACGAMVYDERILSFKGHTDVSLLTLDGRECIPLRFGKYQADLMKYIKGQADLILRNNSFYLYVTLEIPANAQVQVSNDILGIDLGIANIATDSEGVFYSGKGITLKRIKYKRLRSILQHKGTKSAKRKLKKLAKKEKRYVRNINHTISKELVSRALRRGKALALENLKGIRKSSNGYYKEMRWLMGTWSFRQLTSFIQYKAEESGIPVALVNPRDTSRMCSQCSYIAKGNRPSQKKFKCKSCGLKLHADYNAALNIRARAALSNSLLSQAFA